MKNEELLKFYESKRVEIKNRLNEFKQMMNESDERIFAELAFCLCVPQSKATSAWLAIESLMRNGLLYRGTEKQIRPFLNAVRFSDKKVKYIIEARKKFTLNNTFQIKSCLKNYFDPFELREWLIKNMKGFGMKLASHFIRNIGLSFDLAILDVHILKNLKEFGVIKKIPKSLTRKNYLEIEREMKEFSKELKIPMGELDLLFWTKETGIVFK